MGKKCKKVQIVPGQFSTALRIGSRHFPNNRRYMSSDIGFALPEIKNRKWITLSDRPRWRHEHVPKVPQNVHIRVRTIFERSPDRKKAFPTESSNVGRALLETANRKWIRLSCRPGWRHQLCTSRQKSKLTLLWRHYIGQFQTYPVHMLWSVRGTSSFLRRIRFAQPAAEDIRYGTPKFRKT